MSYTMLLADDSVTTHRVMELTFASQDVRVISVADGEQAMERMRDARPDIVVAEVALPRVDGYRLSEHVRSTPGLSTVPVLLLTGAFDVVDEPRVKASGAAGIIVKPFEPDIVIKRVKDLLGLSPKSAAPADERPLEAADSVSAADAGDFSIPEAAAADESGVTSPEAPSGASISSPEDAPATAPTPAGGDILGQLGDAFDELDYQLSETTTGPRMMPPGGGPPFAAPAGSSGTHLAAENGDEPPVFEIDEEWFGGNLARATTGRPAAPAANVADTFHALLAAEQGTVGSALTVPSGAEPVALSEDTIERIAARVAERLSEGVFVDTVRRVVEDVAERLVTEEIARIRARVEEQRR